MADKNKLSPVMQQYVDIKAQNPDALILFRLGDFYEAFFDDARTVSDALQLVLTTRGADGDGVDIPMCGIPWHAADNYLGRLVRAGYNVALVEQMETPEEARARGHKFIDRQVVRVLTPGTLTDDSLLNPKTSNFLVAMAPIGNGTFDIAGCDISTGEFFIGTTDCISDDLARINPAEVIYPESAAEQPQIRTLREIYKTTPVYEKLYRRADIGKIVSRVFGGAIKSDGDNTNCDSAIALLAGYLFNTQRDASLSFRAPYDFKSGVQLLIDAATWKSLEIDSALNPGGLCLMDVLDNTRTAAGARKLAAALRALPADTSEIHRRQTYIGHMVLNPDVMTLVGGALGNLPDVGRAMGRLMTGRGVPRDLHNVARFMTELPNVKLIASRLDADMAARIGAIETHDVLTSRLRAALADAIPTFFRDGGVIRDGFDAALDNMRRLARGAQETIATMQAEYAGATGVATLKIKYNGILGYFIEVPSARADGLMKPESGFIHRQTMATSVRFTTPKLIDLDNDVRRAAEAASNIEAQIISDFIEEIRNISGSLYSTADLLAELDVWYSLAFVAGKYNWVRPDIDDSTAFDVRAGRHPVIEYALRLHGDAFVGNDCNLNSHPIALITGPNMAGKSTYLRQNALIVVLAHLGSFVPAAAAHIGIADQLFSRVGASDNLAAGQSTFMVEMAETSNILRRATNRSFIIFDEIGRGTATYDGMAIAQAVLEFINNMSPRTLFATHYHELTCQSGDNGGALQRVMCLTIQVREHNDQIIFLHRIIPGVANRSYGIHVARMAGMPDAVVTRAEEILTGLESGMPIASNPTPPQTPTPKKNHMRVESPNLFDF